MKRMYYGKKKKRYVPRDLASLKELNIKTALLENIPRDITQLYPEARQIKRQFILHIGDTNTGKTHDALEDFYRADTAVYLAPLRLLALEVQDMSLSRGTNCSLLTGEERDIREGATHISCTVEKMDMAKHFDVCVIDEAQMLSDKDRGWAWTEAILGVNADVIHICMSPNAIYIVKLLISMCQDSYTEIRHRRSSKLIVENNNFVFPDDIQDGDALVAFSRRKVLMLATLLKKKGYTVSVIYGSLPYSVRKAEMARFLSGESRIVVCTDAIGMGVNLPIRRVIFTEVEKFDGLVKRRLNMGEIKQIAGRAGRKGLYDQGYVNAFEGREYIAALVAGKYKQITSCVIQPPRKVLDMPYSLSEIFRIWLKTIDRKCFSVADLKNRIKLAEYIEKNHGEKIGKELEYSLINIPFDENSDQLNILWRSLVDMTADNEPVSRMWYYLDTDLGDINDMKLDDLEQLYKKLDLLNSYCNAMNILEYDEKIRSLKEDVSEHIVSELTNGEFFNKCKRCGKRLEWNHRYGMCDKCYARIKLERSRLKNA
ncbi:MAG: helicase-related protein [Lachnospira sp.]|nr:helicase-related protein [Lachnospira sp.]